ncbi:MAG: sirohydrochlorin chelatase [Candidatus Methanomethylophilaceae archaeon]
MLLSHTVKHAELAYRLIEGLVSRGHHNVYAAFLDGHPGPEEVMASLAESGVDSVMVFPLTVAEGRLTVRLMPERLGMPDNSCSYTYVGDRNVTMRFMTAFGEDPRVLDIVCDRAIDAGADPDSGILVLARGSRNSSNRRMAERVVSSFRSRGFSRVSSCSMKHGDVGIGEAICELVSEGASSVVIAPMVFLKDTVADCLSSELGFSDNGLVGFQDLNVPVIVSEPIGFDTVLVDSIDERIPDGW